MTMKSLFVASFMLAATAAAAQTCLDQARDAQPITIQGLDEAGDLRLADGRIVRLVGIAPRQDDAEMQRFATGIEAWRGRELRLVVLGGADRWGRLPARLFVPHEPSNDMPSLLTAALTGIGAAQPWPEAAYPDCDAKPKPPKRPDSRRSAAATSARSLPAHAASVIDGHDIAALQAQTGRIVAVEGQVASVGERAQRTYLNFSRRRAEAGAVMIPRKLWREMQAAGWTAAGLTGKRIRARGLLSGQDGTLLEVNAFAALELID